MKKYIVITIISALLVSAAVLAGIPLYKVLASTDACLHSGSGDPLSELYEYGGPGEPPEDWYPCGWYFEVRHKGTDGTYRCDCAHETNQTRGDVLLKFYDLSEDLVHTARMELEGYDQSCPGNDEEVWYVFVHVPEGDWKYRFYCREGEEYDPC